MIKPGGPRCPAKNHKALLMFPRIIEKILFLRSPETLCYDEAVASCGCGGIGRRAGFRSQFSQGSGGSNPLIRTKILLGHYGTICCSKNRYIYFIKNKIDTSKFYPKTARTSFASLVPSEPSLVRVL